MIVDDAVFSKFLWIASASFAFCFIAVLLDCVCGCRKRIPKNELLGLAGMVKITNPDENVNFSTSPPNVQLNCVSVISDEHVGDSHDTNKRSSTTLATATRSLPDLPVDTSEGGEKLWGPGEINTDTNSELYATVEGGNGDVNFVDPTRGKKRVLTRGPTADSSYTPSQTDDSLSPYARLKGEHPYDQLQQSEHQYAQVGTNGGGPPVASTSQDTSATSVSSRRFEGEIENGSKSPSLSEPLDDIPAASAIAGSVPANHELPYMTPPIMPPPPTEHFSGDSQDCKGYTSISVREPLARILNAARRGDPHYATVSDDSDEMYAAIEERNTAEYTSGSDTYAQIAPVAVATVPPPSSTTVHRDPSPHRQSQQQHTRQESSSSACSSVISPGSPKREKRQANSPLPEPPAQSPTIDDMYAKVVKKQRSSAQSLGLVTPDCEVAQEDPPIPPTVQASTAPPLESDSDPNYEELHPQGQGIDGITEPDYASLSRRYAADSDPNYESVCCPQDICDPNYESVENQLEPPYEKVDAGNPPLEEDSKPNEAPDYETVYKQDGHPMDLYAQVNKSPEKR